MPKSFFGCPLRPRAPHTSTLGAVWHRIRCFLVSNLEVAAYLWTWNVPFASRLLQRGWLERHTWHGRGDTAPKNHTHSCGKLHDVTCLAHAALHTTFRTTTALYYSVPRTNCCTAWYILKYTTKYTTVTKVEYPAILSHPRVGCRAWSLLYLTWRNGWLVWRPNSAVLVYEDWSIHTTGKYTCRWDD